MENADVTRSGARLEVVSRLYRILGWVGIVWSVLLVGCALFVFARGDLPVDVQVTIGFISVLGILGMILLSLGLIVVGQTLRRRHHYAFCVTVSQFLYLCFPFGTLLGLYAVNVLREPSVKALFGESAGTANASRNP